MGWEEPLSTPAADSHERAANAFGMVKKTSPFLTSSGGFVFDVENYGQKSKSKFGLLTYPPPISNLVLRDFVVVVFIF